MTPSAPQTTSLRRVLGLFWSYSRGHRGWLLRGSLASFVIVLSRLALPFPLRCVARPALAAKGGDAPVLRSLLDDGLDPLVAVGASLFVLFTVLGLADLYQRVCFARFSIGTVRQARAVAIRAIREHGAAYRNLRSGELVSRLIGDTARAKAGLKAFLIHVLTNSVLVLSVSAVLMWVNLNLAGIFLAAFLVVAALTWYSARSMYHVAHRYRDKEGILANRVAKASSGVYGDKSIARLNRKSGDSEAHLTRLEGLCSWSAHGALGLAIVAAVLVGRHEIASGKLQNADLLLFLLYAVLLRAPLAKIVSQGASTGKILACAERIVELCEPPTTTRMLLPPLRSHIHIDGVKVSTKKVHDVRRRRLGPIDLRFRAGEHVAIVGPASSGKTTLLRTLAGEERVRRGRILWDELDISRKSSVDRSSALFFLPESPSWYRIPLNRLLNIDQEGPLGSAEDLNGSLGAWGAVRPIRRHCTTWDAPLASTDLSVTESKAMGLIRAIRADVSLLLLDAPFASMTEAQQRAAMAAIRAWPGTVLVTFRPNFAFAHEFDRVIFLRKGRVVSDRSSEASERLPPSPDPLSLECPP